MIALALVSGCAENDTPRVPAAQPEAPEMSVEQSAAMADGAVTSDEYHESFRRYAACLAEKGYTVLEQGEKYDIIQVGIPEEAVLSGADDACAAREFTAVSTQWQVDHQDNSLEADAAKSCLEDRGLPVPATLNDKLSALQQQGIDYNVCLQAFLAGG